MHPEAAATESNITPHGPFGLWRIYVFNHYWIAAGLFGGTNTTTETLDSPIPPVNAAPTAVPRTVAIRMAVNSATRKEPNWRKVS